MARQNLHRLIDELFARRSWSPEEIRTYLGYYYSTFMLHSAFSDIRAMSSSGGVVSGILIYCLDNSLIDGALVCKSEIINNKIRPAFYIAKTSDEILAARGSKYIETRFVSEALPLIEKFNGRLAVVGLPCDIKILTRRMEKDGEIKRKIILKIGLFCGHNSEARLIDNITEDLEKEAGSRISDFKFRIGSWRGKICATFKNGKTLTKKTALFNDYQNLYFFAQKKCFYCNDHFSYFSDIAVGDIWLYSFKELNVKYNSVIARNTASTELIRSMIQKGHLQGKSIDVSEILNGQSRGVRLHHNLFLKSSVGRIFGVHIPVGKKEKFKWHEFMVACIAFFNWRWSRSKLAPMIFKIPRPVLKIYLYLMKGLQSLK